MLPAVRQSIGTVHCDRLSSLLGSRPIRGVLEVCPIEATRWKHATLARCSQIVETARTGRGCVMDVQEAKSRTMRSFSESMHSLKSELGDTTAID